MMMFDLHLHTVVSFDSSISRDAATTKAREMGMRGIAFTEHNIWRAYKSPYKDFLIINGMEIWTNYGDIIVLGFSTPPDISWDVEKIAQHVHDENGVIIIPHPFSSSPGYMAMNENIYNFLDIIDGIEVTNPKCHVDNRRAKKFAKVHKKAEVGGSDAHRIEMIGCGMTLAEAENEDELIDAIIKRKTIGVVKNVM